MKATQRIFRTADGEVVAEGDPRAAFLLAGEGDDIPDEYRAKAKAFLGEQPEPEPEPEPEPDEPADEKQAEPADNKKAPAARNKKS